MYRANKRKQLIVNADDFGLDTAINHGIMEAFLNGIVTSASIMADGAAFEEAAQFARRNTPFSFGVHLAIEGERPFVFMGRVLSGRISLNKIYNDFERQIEKCVKNGLRPTHLDSHQHIHLMPRIFDIVIELAGKFSIPRVRLSRSRLSYLLKTEGCVRAAGVTGLSILANARTAKVKRHNMKTSDCCYGLVESGHLEEKRLFCVLENLVPGTGELVCHPGVGTEDLASRFDWGYDWQSELNALTNPAIRDFVRSSKIELITDNEI